MTLDVDFIVDLSNVCRSTDLGAPKDGASLQCLFLLEKAIAKSLNGRTPVLRYVADKNLWSKLEKADGKNFVSDWRNRRGRVLLEDDVADGIILKLASTNGWKVITGDFYRDHRRQHPWLQNNSEDFFIWKRDGDQVVLVPRTLDALSDHEISRYSEIKHMKDAKLDPMSRDDRSILESLYQCINPGCELRKKNPSYLPISPNRNRKDYEKLECPSCKSSVYELGFVGRVAQLKFKILETGQTGRITFRVDSPVVIGRFEILRALTEITDEDREACAAVSGAHLQVLVTTSGVQVADNGSTNGSTISRVNKDGSFNPHLDLKQKLTGLNHGDKLYLGGAVEISRSGRKFGFANLTDSTSGNTDIKTQARET